MLHRETHGNGLLITRVGLLGRLRFAGLGARLCAECVLDAGEMQEISIGRRIDEIRRRDEAIASRLEASHHDPGHTVAVAPRRERPVRVHDEQPAAQLGWRHHLMEHCDRDPRIMAKPAHPAVARVEQAVGAGIGRQRQMCAIVVTNSAPERSIALRGPELLNPRVLIGQNRLVRELPPYPAGLFRQDDTTPEPSGSERGRACSEPSPNDGYVCPQGLHIVLSARSAARSNAPIAIWHRARKASSTLGHTATSAYKPFKST